MELKESKVRTQMPEKEKKKAVFHSVMSPNYSSHKFELIEREPDICRITPGGHLTEKFN